MNLNLVYVPGISDVDTLNFANKNDRDTYFDNLDILFVSVPTFYPPHYNNLIKIDVDDMDFNSEVNYLWFEYNNMRYFYFINSISYVSENVISLSITMDTFMTYRFYLNISYAYIERKFINRYNSDGSINRGYIRENFSDGNFIEIYNKRYTKNSDWSLPYHSSDSADGIVVIISASELGTSDVNFEYMTGFNYSDYIGGNVFNTRVSLTHLRVHFVPVKDLTNYDTANPKLHIYNVESPQTLDYKPKNSLRYLGSDTPVLSMFYLPFNTLYGMSVASNSDINIDGAKYAYSKKDNTTLDRGTIVPGYSGSNPRYIVEYGSMKDVYSFGFVISSTFTKHCVPALLDDNYYRISFGESSQAATYPLYNAKKDEFYAIYYPDFLTGARNYQIYCDKILTTTSGTEKGIPDYYNVIVSAPTPIEFSLISNTDAVWFSRNKFTVFGSGVNFAVRCFSAYMGDYRGLAEEAKGLNSALDYYKRQFADSVEYGEPSNFYESSHYRSKVLSAYDAANAPRRTKAEAGYQDTSSLVSTLTTVANVMYAPDGARNVGSITEDVSAMSFYPTLKIYEVQNIDAVANYYHLYAYKVDEFYYHDDLINYVSTRTYFNFIKVYDIDFAFTVLTSSNLQGDLYNRFKKGLRLWNPAYTIGSNLHLDNTEVS